MAHLNTGRQIRNHSFRDNTEEVEGDLIQITLIDRNSLGRAEIVDQLRSRVLDDFEKIPPKLIA